MKNIVIYAGTFDPITNGHLDIIQRTASLFDKIIVAIAKNPSKQPMFSLEERTALVEQSCQALDNVQAVSFSGLLDDLEYEIQLAQLNDKLAHGLETIFLPPSVEWRYLSSTMVREIHKHQGNIEPFVPACVIELLKNRTEKE